MDINKQLKTQEGAKDFMKDISEECRENILLAIKDVRQAEARESKIKNLLFLEKQILAKKNMQPHHRAWLKKRVEDLVKQEYKDSLVQLNECIDFTEAGGLIIHTISGGDLRFKPKQATYDDIKDINGIEQNKNVRTQNKATRGKGLRANFEAVKKIKDAGKKICTAAQYNTILETLPGGENLNHHRRTATATDLFDLLGVSQFGYFPEFLERQADHRYLRSSNLLEAGSGLFIESLSRGKEGSLSHCSENCGMGIWLLED